MKLKSHNGYGLEIIKFCINPGENNSIKPFQLYLRVYGLLSY